MHYERHTCQMCMQRKTAQPYLSKILRSIYLKLYRIINHLLIFIDCLFPILSRYLSNTEKVRCTVTVGCFAIKAFRLIYRYPFHFLKIPPLDVKDTCTLTESNIQLCCNTKASRPICIQQYHQQQLNQRHLYSRIREPSKQVFMLQKNHIQFYLAEMNSDDEIFNPKLIYKSPQIRERNGYYLNFRLARRKVNYQTKVF